MTKKGVPKKYLTKKGVPKNDLTEKGVRKEILDKEGGPANFSHMAENQTNIKHVPEPECEEGSSYDMCISHLCATTTKYADALNNGATPKTQTESCPHESLLTFAQQVQLVVRLKHDAWQPQTVILPLRQGLNRPQHWP